MTKEICLEMIKENKLQTPAYIFDEEQLIDRVTEMKAILDGCDSELCFAIKANPFLVPTLDAVISKYEVCSPGELEICRRYGISGQKIVFSGVVKSREDMIAALTYPVHVITIESIRHWELLKEGVRATGKGTRVLLRLTSGAQFGMEKEDIQKILQEIEGIPDISFAGIHYFAGTQRKGNKYEKELAEVCEFMNLVQAKTGREDLMLEYGPGLSVPYFTGDSFEGPLAAIAALADCIKAQQFSFQTTIELGRYIAASCGYYVTQIMDIKKAEDRNYCLVDGGIHHVNYYGQNMAMRTPVIHHVSVDEKEGEEKEYMICGSLCTFADILVRGLPLKNPQIGDWLLFENIGAYSVTEGNYLFLSRDLPEINVYSSDRGLRCLRKRRGTWEINSREV